jgi:hypothetical protein
MASAGAMARTGGRSDCSLTSRCTTTAKAAAMAMVAYRRGTTGLEHRPSRKPALDGSGRSAHAYGSEGRVRHVPDQVVGQGSSRSFADRLTGLPTRAAARSVHGR